MEAAEEVIVKLSALGWRQGEAGLRRIIASHFLTKGASFQALQLSVAPLAEARALPTQAIAPSKLPPLPGNIAALPETAASLQSIASLAAALASQLGSEQLGGAALPAEALRTAEDFASALQSLGDKPCEAAALSALSAVFAAQGESARDAARAAAGAVRAAKAAEGNSSLIAALEASICTSFACKDADEALRAATELAALAKDSGDRSLQARATLSISRANLANEEPTAALEAGVEAEELFRGVGDKAGEASAVCVSYDVEVLLGRPVAASSRANKVLALVKDDKKAEAAATLMLASVDTASEDALGMCRQAVTLFKGIGDSAGEAAAHLATANAQLSHGRKLARDGLQSATAALSAFKELADRAGEAAALAAVGASHAQLGDGPEAEKAAKEAQAIFSSLRDPIGESFAAMLVKGAKAICQLPKEAKVTIDEASAIAHVEVSDTVAAPSLQEVIATLQSSKVVKCIVLHVEGAPPAGEQESGGTAAPRAFGRFLMGLRMIGLPVICAIWGKISGPMWTFVLTSDYRFAATSTTFMCPIWGKLECMGSLIGHNTATQLCLANGPRDSLVMLENGVLHQLQKGKEDTKKAATEMARRITATPAMACRKQPFVLSHQVEEYAMAAAQGKVAA